jgi:peptidyl-prolyl cis-trans isomerase C
MKNLLVLICCLACCFSVQAKETDALSPTDVLLTRGAIKITVDDLNRYLADKVPPEKRALVISQPGYIKTTLENIFIIKYLAAQGAASGVADMEQIEWSAKLHRDRSLMDAYMAHQVRAAEEVVDWEKAAREIYAAEPDRFFAKEQVRVMHILVSTKERDSEEAKKLAESYRKRLIDGEDFSELAKSISDDPSVINNGGDLGFFGRGRMVKEFEEVAFSMTSPGSISEPVETSYGYHLIKFVDRKPAGKKPFAAVKSQIIKGYKARVASQARQDVITKARNATDVVVDEVRVVQYEEELRRNIGKSEEQNPLEKDSL